MSYKWMTLFRKGPIIGVVSALVVALTWLNVFQLVYVYTAMAKTTDNVPFLILNWIVLPTILQTIVLAGIIFILWTFVLLVLVIIDKVKDKLNSEKRGNDIKGKSSE